MRSKYSATVWLLTTSALGFAVICVALNVVLDGRLAFGQQPTEPPGSIDAGGQQTIATTVEGARFPVPAPAVRALPPQISGQRGPADAVYGYYSAQSARSRSTRVSAEESKQAQAALADLQEDSNDEDARATLNQILGKQFDDDIKNRKQHIDRLEEEIESLKNQIAKREDARQRIIELRIELMLNEAEGLGFPTSWNAVSTPGGRGSAFTVRPQWTESIIARPVTEPRTTAPNSRGR